MRSEKIILGIDPGTRIMGYGVLRCFEDKIEVLQYGVIQLEKYDSQAMKLKKIYERVTQLIEEFLPDEVALEAPFYGKNVQSMLKLGRAQGVAMTAALMREIPITEYAPLKVKQAVTGKGRATKQELAKMLEKILNIQFSNDMLLDASDALGVALCHYYQSSNVTLSSPSYKSWKGFIESNPHRIQ